MIAKDDGSSRVSCNLVLVFGSRDYAEKVHKAVELDNQGYLNTRVEGSTILADIRASSLNSLLHTLDDFLSCMAVADSVVSEGGQSE